MGDKHDKITVNKRLTKYLSILIKSQAIFDKYNNALPIDLYQKTLKFQTKDSQ